MSFLVRKHIKLHFFLLFFSFWFISCNRTQQNSSGRNTNLEKKADSIIITYQYLDPQTADYSYITAKEIIEIKETKDTIEGIIVREAIIDVDHLKIIETDELEEKYNSTEIGKYNVIQPKKLRMSYTSPYRYFSINFENDAFLAMDYYFTNGITFEYYHPVLERSFYNYMMIPYRKESVNYYGLTLVQNMYTPTRLDTVEIIHGDRPFASYLYLGFRKVIYDENNSMILRSELDVGLLGPTSLGGMIQSTFHRTEPTGWKNQISNDIIVNYNIDVEKGIYQSEHLSFNGTAGIKAGTLYDNIYGGVNIVVGNFVPHYSGFGLRCNHNNIDKLVQYGFVLSGQMTFVGYDATMQGGLFSDNEYYIDSDLIKRLTHSAKFGLFFKYKWFGLNANIIHLSHEFKGGRPHKWVHFSTTFCL